MNKIKKNYKDTDLVLKMDNTNFTSHGVNIGNPNLNIAAGYLDEICGTINGNNYDLCVERCNSIIKEQDKPKEKKKEQKNG